MQHPLTIQEIPISPQFVAERFLFGIPKLITKG